MWKLKNRLPETLTGISSIINNHFLRYPSPVNFNYFWNFGSLCALALSIQIVSGLFLAMHYVPEPELAFSSIEHIMRDVKGGWFVRYTHSNGSSFFFIVLYAHMSRSLYYQSYTYPRGYVWVSGLLIFILVCATAFLGYVLPWGQMSFWGATVITNMLTAIPYVGESVTNWLWGGYGVAKPTLQRFFTLHYFLPFIITGLVGLHIYFLHLSGSNNPLGTDPADNTTLAHNFIIKDSFGIFIYLFVFLYVITFHPNALAHPDNYVKANCLMTPRHVVPEWYFLPYYAMLRCIPYKGYGILTMLGSIFMFFFIPIINQSWIRCPHFKPLHFRFFIFIWFYNFLLLGKLGGLPIHEHFTWVTQIATAYFFFFWLIYIPLVTFVENNFMIWSPEVMKILGEPWPFDNGRSLKGLKRKFFYRLHNNSYLIKTLSFIKTTK